MADDNIDKALPNVEQTIKVPGEEEEPELQQDHPVRQPQAPGRGPAADPRAVR